jgi:hypothetical protein
LLQVTAASLLAGQITATKKGLKGRLLLESLPQRDHREAERSTLHGNPNRAGHDGKNKMAEGSFCAGLQDYHREA